MKNVIIADSSGLVSLFFEKDSNNKFALTISKEIARKNLLVYIPSEVFSETLNVVGKKFTHKITLILASSLFNNKRFFIIDSTKSFREIALEKFKIQLESASFTDCVVMAVADYFKTKLVFGFDRIFQKNGYVLPK